MYKPIGGYFELADRECDSKYPINGVRLNTCRNALEYILIQLHDVKHVYLAYYTCEAVIEPLKRLNLSFDFYHINNRLEIAEDIKLQDQEYIIANNYFGIKDSYIKKLAKKYGKSLIVDNAQALFAPTLPQIKAIYSTRKYVGVADGGIAVGVSDTDALKYDIDTTEHDSHLLIRKRHGAEAGFKEFQHNECLLDNQPIRRMAFSTQDILTHIDYEKVISKRRANFEYLHMALKHNNQLGDLVTECLTEGFECPMIYPYIGRMDDNLRTRLIENKVFVAKYWPNVLEWSKPQDLEYQLAEYLIPFPIDQRYDEQDMIRIALICNYGFKR